MIDKPRKRWYNLKREYTWKGADCRGRGAEMKEFWDIYNADGNVIPGHVTERGKHELRPGEYHLVVFAWIINDKNEFIISRRQKGKIFAGKWECTGGCALAGETSVGAAVREVSEEIGLTLDPSDGELFKRYKRNYPHGACAICDVWVFRGNFELSDMTLQTEEVSEARLVSAQELLELFGSAPYKRRYEYLPELVEKYTSVKI